MKTVPVDIDCRCGMTLKVAATVFPPQSPGARIEVDPTHCPHCGRSIDLDDALTEAQTLVEDSEVRWSSEQEEERKELSNHD